MKRKTVLMRVPIPFKKTCDDIAKSNKIPTTTFLDRDGTRILQNARKFTEFIFSKR